MNAIVPQSFGALSTRFQGQVAENDLGAGVTGGFGNIGYKGKVWSIRHRGEERALMRDDGDGPRGSIEIVILKSSTVISKVWYEKGFEEGSSAPPDCWSTNGVTPDPAATKKQAAVCALCPKNVFGTSKRQDGTPGKGKACSDSKRLAVVPLGDIANEMFGGPMLLRVPASSMNDVATYGAQLQKMGYPYFAVGTRVAFDPAEAYPKFVFSPIRPLSDAEADLVIEMRGDARVDRILAETEHAVVAPVEQKPQLTFEQAPANPPQPAPSVASPSTQAAPPSTTSAPPAQPAPAASPSNGGGFGGFGGPAPATSQVTAPPAPTKARRPKPAAVAPAPTPVVEAAPALAPVAPATAEEFDDALDAEMEALMGK